MPRRKTPPLASARIDWPTAATRRAISSLLKTSTISLTWTRPIVRQQELIASGANDCSSPRLRRSLAPRGMNGRSIAVGIAIIRDLERIGNFDAGDPDDLAVPDQERNAIAIFDGNFAIDEKVFEFFLVTESEGTKAITVASIADGEVRRGTAGELEGLVCPTEDRRLACPDRRGRLSSTGPLDRECCVELRNEDRPVHVDLEFVVVDRLRRLAENQSIVSANEFERLRHADTFDVVHFARQSDEIVRRHIA